jgi:hypothetical protein
MEKYKEYLARATVDIRAADNMIYMSYPIIKDKRLLLSSIDRLYQALVCVINAILQYDYLWKRIKLYQDSKENFEVFMHTCAPRYGITDLEKKKIHEFLSVIESHKKSPIEFLRKDKIVIMTDSLQTKTIDQEIIKQYLNIIKNIAKKAQFLLK